MEFDKNKWQREYRRAFAKKNGYSTASHYACGGNREAVLLRDGHACVKCGMTDEQHKLKWRRPITVDHKNKNRSNNTLKNLQTMCLKCHGNKDLIPRLRRQKIPKFKARIIALKNTGMTYRAVADAVGFSIASTWKWIKLWEREANEQRTST